MTDSQANIIASFMAWIVQVALISLGVYFIGEALGYPLRFFQITTIACALLVIRSGMVIQITRNS